MKEFKGKVAVVTGAASGIGRALAKKCCKEGMNVVIADIDATKLSETEKELKKSGGAVISVITDVSKASDVDNLAQKTLDAFGAVHLLFNNAGVGTAGSLWDHTLNDLKWVIGVNLWGVIHGVRTFVPIMLKQDTECHVVNTSSLSGIVPGSGIYGITKHGVVALSESLAGELPLLSKKIKVSVLCPSFVSTNIMNSEQHRPSELQNDPTEVRVLNEIETEYLEMFTKTIEQGSSPEEVAELVFYSIINEKFYILTDRDARITIKRRMQNILNAFQDFKMAKDQIRTQELIH